MNGRFPRDARREKVLKALYQLGFIVKRDREHITLERLNRDGSRSSITLPNHRTIKSSTLKMALTQAGVDREEFLIAFDRV